MSRNIVPVRTIEEGIVHDSFTIEEDVCVHLERPTRGCTFNQHTCLDLLGKKCARRKRLLKEDGTPFEAQCSCIYPVPRDFSFSDTKKKKGKREDKH